MYGSTNHPLKRRKAPTEVGQDPAHFCAANPQNQIAAPKTVEVLRKAGKIQILEGKANLSTSTLEGNSTFGQSSSSSSRFGYQSVFGQTSSNSTDPFAPKPFGSPNPFGSQAKSSIFGSRTSTGVFGQPSSPLSSTPTFGASTASAFGNSMRAFGSSTTTAFGTSSHSFGG